MVWASPDTADDAMPGVDSVKTKPLKRRCGSRAGLSKYYSSKSQSFSSLDKVQCTPFGASAQALAKRPSSFDLRRGSLSTERSLPRASRFSLEESCMIVPKKEAEEVFEDIEDEEEQNSTADRCPCNDTIFSDPSNAFASPDCSPSASPLNLYDSCSLTAAAASFNSLQHQQQMLTSEYLGQLTALLPFQHQGSCSYAPAVMDRSCSSSSCCSGSHGNGSHGSGSLSTCDSGSVAAGYLWQPLEQLPQPVLLPGVCRQASGPGSCGAVPMPCCCSGAPSDATGAWATQADWGNEVEARFASSGGLVGSERRHFVDGSGRSRNCLSAGGSVLNPCTGIAACAGALQPTSWLTAVGGAAQSTAPTRCSTAAAAAAAATAAVAVLSIAGVSPHVRRLGLGSHSKVRLSVAARGRHLHVKPVWGSTEDLIACLTLSDKHPHHLHVMPRRMGLAHRSGAGGFGDAADCAAVMAASSRPEAATVQDRRPHPAQGQNLLGRLTQQQEQGQQGNACGLPWRAGAESQPSDGCRSSPGAGSAAHRQGQPGHPHLQPSMLPGPSEPCWAAQRLAPTAGANASPDMELDNVAPGPSPASATAGGACEGSLAGFPLGALRSCQLQQQQLQQQQQQLQQSCTYGSAPSHSSHGFLEGAY